MSKPIQLIVNNVLCPTTTRDRYLSYPDELRELLTMSDGTMVEEVVGVVQRISYSYDKMDDGTFKLLLAAIRGGGVKTVTYLPDDLSEELVTSRFLVESITQPTLQFYRDGVPRWHNFGFTLREAEPHA